MTTTPPFALSNPKKPANASAFLPDLLGDAGDAWVERDDESDTALDRSWLGRSPYATLDVERTDGDGDCSVKR